MAGVGLKWDLDCGITRHQANALVRRANAVAAERADLESQISLQVRQAWLDVQNARERLKVTEAAITEAEENLRTARNRYTDGVGSNTEVMDALTLRLRSFVNYYSALYNAALAQLRLRRAIGDL